MKKQRNKRDIEKVYTKKEYIKKLRRLADALEQNHKFVIHVAGEKITVPAHAVINIEHERDGEGEELEFQIIW